MIEFTLNGAPMRLDIEDDTPLLWALRENLKLTGTKYGCGIGACGACTVHLGGAAVRACQTPVASVHGQAVTTIEGFGDQLYAQVESAVVFGLTAALRGQITIKDGAVEQSNFHDYPLLRMDEAPLVEVFVVPSTAPPTGIGEPGTPPIAPAVANAVYAATGARLRSLPLTLTA